MIPTPNRGDHFDYWVLPAFVRREHHEDPRGEPATKFRSISRKGAKAAKVGNNR